MDLETFNALVAAERERQKTPRERELDRQIAEIAQKHQRAYWAEIAPLVAELVRINETKPPLPIRLEDGRVMQYDDPQSPHE